MNWYNSETFKLPKQRTILIIVLGSSLGLVALGALIGHILQ